VLGACGQAVVPVREMSWPYIGHSQVAGEPAAGLAAGGIGGAGLAAAGSPAGVPAVAGDEAIVSGRPRPARPGTRGLQPVRGRAAGGSLATTGGGAEPDARYR
jgi:hypothetical protein